MSDKMTMEQFRSEVALVFKSPAIFREDEMLAGIGDFNVSYDGAWRITHCPIGDTSTAVREDCLVNAVIKLSRRTREMISMAYAIQESLASALEGENV